MSATHKLPLAPLASTGTASHPSVSLHPAADKLCGVLVIEAVGATPTITAKLQGTLDDASVADGAANWFDLPILVNANDTVAANRTETAVGSYPMWLSQAHSRFVRRVRLVTSANTNVTYHGDGFEQYHS